MKNFSFLFLVMILSLGFPLYAKAQSDINPPVARIDNMHTIIQDYAKLFTKKSRSDYEKAVRANGGKPGQFTLLTVNDYRNYQPHPPNRARTIEGFVGLVFSSWKLFEVQKTVLIVHDSSTNILILKLGHDFSISDKRLIRAAFNKEYQSRIGRGRSTGANHAQAVQAFLSALPNDIFQTHSKQTVPTQIEKITKRGKFVRDYADILAPSVEKRLTEMMTAPFLRDQITLITLTDYENYTSETMKYRPPKNFIQFADKIAGDLGIFGSEFQLVILHDLKRNRIEIRGGYQYSLYDIQTIKARYAEHFGYLLAQTAHLQALEDLIKSMPGGADYVVPKEPLEPHDQTAPRDQTKDKSKSGINFVIGAIALSIISIAVIRMIRFALVNRPRPEIKQRKSRISAWKKARRGRIGKSIFVPKPIEKNGKITCPRCGGPVKITKKAARGYFANAHSHRSCTRCSWFSIAVPRQKKS